MTILEKLEAAIPGLEMLIEVHYGVKVKGRMKVNVEINPHNNITYRIQSDSLTDMLSPFTRLIFQDIQFISGVEEFQRIVFGFHLRFLMRRGRRKQWL